MQSYYAMWGSPLQLILDESIATAYNRRVDQFLEAQVLFEQVHGRKWDPISEPLMMTVDNEAQKAFDDVGNVVNLLVEINGGGLEIPEEICVSDYLVKVDR